MQASGASQPRKLPAPLWHLAVRQRHSQDVLLHVSHTDHLHAEAVARLRTWPGHLARQLQARQAGGQRGG